MTTANQTLVGQLWPAQSQGLSLLRALFLMLIGTLFVAGAAHIAVPIKPVPMTLQTLAVLIVGGAYGWRLGGATLALYAVEGAAGLPVFTPTADGYPGIAGPTGGYIIGFILAAALVGYLAERGWDRNPFTAFAAALLGSAALYIPGLLWLHSFPFITGWEMTLQGGLFPFIRGDMIKAALAASAFPLSWSLIRHER